MCVALHLINSLKSKSLQLKQGMKESKLANKELTANLFTMFTVASAGADVTAFAAYFWHCEILIIIKVF